MRFRTLLFFISAAAVTLPCLVMGWFQYTAVEREFAEDDRTRAEISLLVSERLEAKVDNAVSLVTAAAEILKSEEGVPTEKLNQILEELRKASPDILNMHFDNPSAVSMAFSPQKNKHGESNIGVSHKERSHWQNPHVLDGLSVSSLVQAVGASDRKIVNITKPVYSNGRFVGLAVAALDLEQIAAQVLKGFATDAYQIGIFGRNGEVIFSSGKSVPLHNLTIEERTHRSFTFSNAEYYGYVRPLAVTDWSVGVFSRTVDRKAVLVQLFIRNVFVWLATFLTAIVIGFLASISVVRAVEKLTRQMTAARILPDKSERIKSPRELVQLQRTYGRMQERLITAQNRLKELNFSLEEKVKKQVQTIQRHEALLTSLFSDMKEGIVLFNEKLEMRFCNPSAVRLLNLSEEEAKKRFLALVKEMHQSRDKHLFIQSQGFDLELRMFESGAKDVFCVFVRDATSELQIDRLKDELIGIAAHELKTPLAGVRMAAECLSKTVQDPESKETAAELLESADEMKSMISRWLDVAKLQTGSYEIHPEFCLIKPMIRKALKHFSGFKDFECSLEISPDAAVADSAMSASEFLKNGHCDLIILDYMMPEIDGMAFLAELRKKSSIPVIMLSAREEIAKKTQALELGADDYVVKPFSIEEMTARIRAILRRSGGIKSGPAAPTLAVNGPLIMDPDKRTCRYKNQEIKLADTEFRLLFILVKRPGTIFTHEDLLRRVWGAEFIGELNYLRVSLSRIRKKLTAAGFPGSAISSYSGIGYYIEDLSEEEL